MDNPFPAYSAIGFGAVWLKANCFGNHYIIQAEVFLLIIPLFFL